MNNLSTLSLHVQKPTNRDLLKKSAVFMIVLATYSGISPPNLVHAESTVATKDILHYSGADNGSITFPHASCLSNGGKLIMLTAGSETEIGPKFALSINKSGSAILEFVPKGKNELSNNFVASSSSRHGIAGVAWSQRHKTWSVVFTHAQLQNPRGSGALVLNGSIACTEQVPG
ncbi:hypothetical protein [Halothiobacillus diazotrophicus]|uniref:hypothetical protein n=1 Tax=Halothiobacillus diazotrophicus TaxID=1860122 RepID=UPI0012E94CC8|nr:hypothetical protein [Halothiobacillus diazotrophicus]